MSQLATIDASFNALPLVKPEHMARVTEGFCLTEPVYGQPCVCTILGVGAIYDNLTPLHPRDISLSRFGLQCATEIRLPISKQPSIEVVNRHYRHDFFDPVAYKAQIVAVCCIPKDGNADPAKTHPDSLLSPHGNNIALWRQRIAEVNPLIAVSCEYLNAWEISVAEACPEGYSHYATRTIQITPTRRQPLFYRAHAIVRNDLMPR